MMKILSIGNSFSDNAQTYLPELFAAGGVQAQVANLYIGGCSLERHFSNSQTNVPDYGYRINHQAIGNSSLETGLLDDEWDYITFQQASHFSGLWETYEPYLEPLAEYVRKRCPKAKFAVHQTWAYETGSVHSGFASHGNDQKRMYEMLTECYNRAAKLLDAPVIPCGDAVQLARATEAFDYAAGKPSLNSDGFHLSHVCGCYLAGAVWYEFFSGKAIADNPFVPVKQEFIGRKQGVPAFRDIESTRPTPEQLSALHQAAHQAILNRK